MNILKRQGHVINSDIVNVQDSQYILNWIAAGGNQHNNNSVTDVWGDNSYNIPNNIISTNFTSKHNYNVSIHDAQYINNWLQADFSGNSKLFNNKLYKLEEYTYPISDNWVVLVTHEPVTINGNVLHKNRLYLKRKNNTDASFNKYILTNSIPYLNLEQGHIIKRVNRDYPFDVGAGRVNIYKTSDGSYESNSRILRDVSRVALNIGINYNNNSYLFPPNQKVLDICNNYLYYTYLNVNEKVTIPTESINNITYKNVNNEDVTLDNRGIESVDLSNSSNRLTILNTINTTTKNLLNESGHNTKSWILAGQEVNDTQGHFIGQFVFDSSANGNMIYQYYYSTDVDDSQYTDKSPYTVYFNINNSRLEFPELWPENFLSDKSTIDFIQKSDSSSQDAQNIIDSAPWGRDDSGLIAYIFADIYKDPNICFLYKYYYSDREHYISYTRWNNFKVTYNQDVSGSSLSNDNIQWANKNFGQQADDGFFNKHIQNIEEDDPETS